MRAALLAVSVAALALLAVGLRQADDQRRGRDAVLPQRTLSPPEARHADRLLRRAADRHPGVEPEILRGILELDRERPRAAIRTLSDVTRREPRNIEAWAWLGNAARDAGDDRLVARVRARIRALRPPVRDG